jgi:hypothetical protein
MCRHCRIFFLTDPRNAGRTDLRCPFGCRQAHRKNHAKKRSVEYYQTWQGKIKKSYLNQRRSEKGQLLKEKDLSNSEKKSFDNDMISYLQSIISLIEGRRVSQKELLTMLAKKMRQHSMVGNKKIVYTKQEEQIRSP